jgi:hypothetical protein
MDLPKLNALVFCVKAVVTEPWWNLVGVFEELAAQYGRVSSFDAFVRFGDMRSDRDSRVTLRFVDPESGAMIREEHGLIRGGGDRTSARAIHIDVGFPREDVYFVEILVDGQFLDSQKLPVIMVG